MSARSVARSSLIHDSHCSNCHDQCGHMDNSESLVLGSNFSGGFNTLDKSLAVTTEGVGVEDEDEAMTAAYAAADAA